MMAALSAFVKEVNGRPYKTSPLQLVRAWAQTTETEDMSSLFCSQLIAAAYRSMGLLRSDVIADNFMPADFAGDVKGRNGSCVLQIHTCRHTHTHTTST